MGRSPYTDVPTTPLNGNFGPEADISSFPTDRSSCKARKP